MKKLWIVFLSTALMFAAGCGSSKQETPETQPKEENTETAEAPAEETKAEEPAKETAETPVTNPDASYTDPSAFAGFDSYTTDYSGSYVADAYAGGEVVMGKTVLKDYYKGTINETEQLDDVTHDDTREVEMIEPHKAAKVETTYIGPFGDENVFYVYNNTDAPAKAEDCVIIGVENEADVLVSFANGIVIYQRNTIQLKEDPAESFKAILGEPYETDADDRTTEYTWRDQNNDHIFEVDVYSSDGIWQIIEYKYVNFSY